MKVKAVAFKRDLQKALEEKMRGMSRQEQLAYLQRKFGHPRRKPTQAQH